jgi:hypothetical protein
MASLNQQTSPHGTGSGYGRWLTIAVVIGRRGGSRAPRHLQRRRLGTGLPERPLSVGDRRERPVATRLAHLGSG